jgi:hypothetical protein
MKFLARHSSLFLFCFSFVVYLLTMDRSASWWDCGEFITTGYGLQIGHPPGAPLYQLITHCAMLLSFGNPLWVAPLSNAVSALCGALTVMILYKTLRLLLPAARPAALAGGALCYLFCDTAWFSAVESEVYSMAMLFCSLQMWLMLRWEKDGDHRLLALIALLAGLGVCVHLMTLLVMPMLLWIFIRKNRRGLKDCKASGLWSPWQRTLTIHLSTTLLLVFFFLLGLTPYAIIPLRAQANPPINEGHPATVEDFKKYIGREQYEKAPLYPRMWRERDYANWQTWNGGSDGLWGNLRYYGSYQFGFMYCRYIMFNFIGRENQAYNPEKGLSPFNHRYALFVLPFLLGLWGMMVHFRRHRGDFGAVLMAFLFGGIILNLYLNHPCYEPRDRDYAYILSFYAFALWIGVGAAALVSRFPRRWAWALLAAAPLLMAAGNWNDHDRSHCHSVHDISLNHLQSCDHGAILFSHGDNDTFPLWYLRHVERRRTDMDIYNINLTDPDLTRSLLRNSDGPRPLYFTHYAYERYKDYFPGRFRCEGFCWRLLPDTVGATSTGPLRRHITDSIRWHITDGEYVDRISRNFLKIWKTNTREL